MNEPLSSLALPPTLRERINVTVPPSKTANMAAPSFVLYMPTVVLRKTHNPAFALACHLANHYQVPLIVLAIVVDDQHLPNISNVSSNIAKPVVMASRRLAFLLEALQCAARAWQEHGAATFVRVHGPQCRKPHHLTLARQASAIVFDEPFVNPFLRLVETTEQAAKAVGSIPCFRVDGSTTVPPVSVLSDKIRLPNRAWKWEQMAQKRRASHVRGAVRDGHLDAPALDIRLDADDLLQRNSLSDRDSSLSALLPSDWRNETSAAPGQRPWTATELESISNLKDWATHWPGADASVPPCSQTHGAKGQARWNHFRAESLKTYAKLRNQVQKPHAVSRMSCYLNYGTVSIFQIIHDVQQQSGTSKYQDEILKWREMSYAHAFANPHTYNQEAAVPAWARKYLEDCRKQGSSSNALSLERLENSESPDTTWNVMQSYLVETGELHNNARMSWGKTIVHWQKTRLSVNQVVSQLCYLNDRYALDGLSPPSYAGLLWCLGWCDKPQTNGSISEKVAWRYRVGPEGFEEAKRALLNDSGSPGTAYQPSITSMLRPTKKQKADNDDDMKPVIPATEARTTKTNTLSTIPSFFSSTCNQR